MSSIFKSVLDNTQIVALMIIETFVPKCKNLVFQSLIICKFLSINFKQQIFSKMSMKVLCMNSRYFSMRRLTIFLLRASWSQSDYHIQIDWSVIFLTKEILIKHHLSYMTIEHCINPNSLKLLLNYWRVELS